MSEKKKKEELVALGEQKKAGGRGIDSGAIG